MTTPPVRLVPLRAEHAPALLAGQDEPLEREVIGGRWTPGSLAQLCERAARWRPDGPIRQLIAFDADGATVGGGGLRLLGPGLVRGEADASYWVLASQRGRGFGSAIAAALAELARADPRVRTLVLRIAPGNTASRAVAGGIGACFTGRTERHPADARRPVERWELPVA